MKLSREKIQRMIDGGAGGSTGGGGGINPSELAGYATQAWVEGNYVSKMFFNQMFELQYSQRVLTKDGETVIDDETTDLVATPNTFIDTTTQTRTDEETGYTIETTNTITGIKAKTGLWTPSYLSALGQNSSGGGGGGGGASALSDLLDVQLSSPTNGQVLMYNSTLGKWINGTVQSSGGTVTSITMSVPTGFSVSPSTITTNGTFAISFASGYSLPTTAKQSNWDMAYGWGNHANAGYASADDVYTKSQADGKFMTIEAFQRLFQPLDSNGNVVAHPYSSGVDNIKALFGLWTQSYLSALGQNSSGGGGGGGGASALSDLLDVQLSSPTNGQVLMYNSTLGKWINGTVQSSGGTVTSITMSVPTGFSVSPSTITTNGTFAISFASGYSLPTTAKQSNWDMAYGWGNHANAGYASADDVYTKSQADGKFMTIEAFQRLFQPLDSNGNVVAHPYSSGVDNIKALFGLWTQSYLSALGQNSSGGGGGGGSSTLHDLLDVNIPATMTQANDGQVLMYSYSQNKWINGTPSVSWGNITSKPTTLSGYGITDAKIQNGTITLGSDSITPLTSFTETDPTVPAWAKQPSKPSYNFSELTSHPTTIAGYGITDAKFGTAGTDYVSITLGSTTKNVLTDHQTVSGTFWGQSWQNGGTVTGNMSSVGTITMSGNIDINNAQAIRFKDYGGTYRNVMTFNSGNVLAIGYHVRQNNYVTDIQGGRITFAVNQNQTGDAYRLEAFEINPSGRVLVKQGTQGIQIGNGLLTWDEDNKAIKVESISEGSVVSGNFYATGAVSALGMNSGSSGSIDTLKVNTAIQCSDSGISFTYRMLQSLNPEEHKPTYDPFINLFKESEDQNPLGPTRNYYPCADFNYMVLRGRNGANLDINWWINSNGNAKFNRVYLSSTVYLYTDGSNVKVSINGTSYTLNKS